MSLLELAGCEYADFETCGGAKRSHGTSIRKPSTIS